MEPLLGRAVGDDRELKMRVHNLFHVQAKLPKSRISQMPPPTQNVADDLTGSIGEMGQSCDEVEFCRRLARDQMPLFRRSKNKIAELCY